MLRLKVLILVIFSCLLSFGQAETKLEQAMQLLDSDPEEAERILDSITVEELGATDDKIKAVYHLFAAIAISKQGLYSEKKLNHLLWAKDIFDTKLGIFSYNYFDLISMIGDEYEALGNDTDALLVNEEGFVKALSVFNDENENFQRSVRQLRNNIAHLYRKHHHDDMADYFDAEEAGE